MDKNTRTIINMNTWERRGNYEFFKNFANPTYSVTFEVDAAQAYANCKVEESSFFCKTMHSILKAVNEIPELCYRIEYMDGQETVVQYRKIAVTTPIKVSENGRFHTVKIPYSKTFSVFQKNYRDAIAAIPKDDKINPYSAEMNPDKGFKDYVNCSCLPNLHFTSITAAFSGDKSMYIPLINVGKAQEKDGKLMMPIAISVHHGLCDGHHVSVFAEKLQENLIAQ